ncbi:MAG: hypothetical protein PUP93_27735 [Rhizonema sp. NSF051]|nr:hypothetical protein [Rhizonema sp. NSF051]
MLTLRKRSFTLGIDKVSIEKICLARQLEKISIKLYFSSQYRKFLEVMVVLFGWIFDPTNSSSIAGDWLVDGFASSTDLSSDSCDTDVRRGPSASRHEESSSQLDTICLTIF